MDFNLFDAELGIDDDEPDGYRAPYAKVRDQIGARRLAGTVVVLREGEAVCPYHYELVEEEWLFVLAGTPTVRTPSGEDTLLPGDIVCFPRGPDGAHKIANATTEPARVLIVSERADCAATVYEDSDKIGIFAPDTRMLFPRTDGRNYWDGEGT
ncbi:MAG: cupin domain-containing protein [Solirubrobacteraceae bacterium]